MSQHGRMGSRLEGAFVSRISMWSDMPFTCSTNPRRCIESHQVVWTRSRERHRRCAVRGLTQNTRPWTLLPQGSSAGSTLRARCWEGIRFSQSALSEWGAWFLIFVWFYSMFFRALFPTGVILAVVGQKGSGKTTLFRISHW